MKSMFTPGKSYLAKALSSLPVSEAEHMRGLTPDKLEWCNKVVPKTTEITFQRSLLKLYLSISMV